LYLKKVVEKKNKMQVTIDQQSGFCFGVVYAIEMAEDYLRNNDRLYCLGDNVHNDEEVRRLQHKGLVIIDYEALEQMQDCTVLIRAHGEPPETYRLALENNIRLIDASCPVVLKLQNRVRKSEQPDKQIVIFGKKGHAEVNGLVGQTLGRAIVISEMEELDQLDFSQPIELFSQTTKSTDKFYRIREEMERRMRDEVHFKSNDTICRQVSNREPQLRIFSTQFDGIIFVAGKKSSNGRVLFEVCKSVNPYTYFVSSDVELQADWFVGKQTIGICGATSTPMWLMEAVKQAIEDRFISAPLDIVSA